MARLHAFEEVGVRCAMDRASSARAVKVLTFERIDRQPGSAALLWMHGGGFIAGTASQDA
jgi:hypothetical protein